MSHRVVLDTHCIISALIFSQEKLAWLRQGWQAGRFTPLVNNPSVSELLRVLAYPKFKLTKAEQGLLLADFLPYAETVPMSNSPVDFPMVRDAADIMFLSLAVTGSADVLVTGDNDLLVLKSSFQQTPILSLAEFAVWLGENS